MAQASNPQPTRTALVAVGPILGGGVAALVVVLSDHFGVVGAAIFACLGSIAGWGLQSLFTHKQKGVPAVLTILAFIGGLIALGVLPAKDAPVAGDDGSPTSTAPLIVPDRTMSFAAVPADQIPADLDGLIGMAKSRYGDPQRLVVRHMYFDSDPEDGYPAVVYAFTGSTAIALAEDEWDWFAAGNSGDLHTVPEVSGEVRCAFHDQETGVTRAECWRWDDRVAIQVSGIKVPSDATRLVAPAIEDLFANVVASY